LRDFFQKVGKKEDKHEDISEENEYEIDESYEFLFKSTK